MSTQHKYNIPSEPKNKQQKVSSHGYQYHPQVVSMVNPNLS